MNIDGIFVLTAERILVGVVSLGRLHRLGRGFHENFTATDRQRPPLIGCTSAGAVIMFGPTPSGTGNNVVFNLQPPDQTGTTVFGNINDPNNTLVQFTSTQVLTTPSSGQARIESVPNNILNNLQTTIPGFFFSQAVFNLDATANGSASINAFDQSGSLFSFLLPLSGGGQNFFTLTTAGGELISRVAFTTTVGLGDVSQIRFGGVAVGRFP